jgi:FkbM family methyltransferase
MQLPFMIARLRGSVIAGVRAVLRRFGLAIVRHGDLERLLRAEDSLTKLDRVFASLPQLDETERSEGRRFYDFCMEHHEDSAAQLFQDLLVLFWLGELREGYFVEVGAGDGISLSNTYLLERDYAWKGIVVEPARVWNTLDRHRNCHVDRHCIWSKSGDTLVFNEVVIPELSTISEFTSRDAHRETRTRGRQYPVETLSLNDLLRRYDAPRVIEFLSIDTEGSELEILEQFDFDYYKVKILAVEHNYTSNRERLHALLTSHGFRRRLRALSHFDDWYSANEL